jgi:hypothetical protein
VILAILNLNIYLIYLIAILAIAIVGIYYVINVFKNMEKDFILIESVRKKYN